jgi:tRNA 2-thiocytidine biosynthesis protein TtcA
MTGHLQALGIEAYLLSTDIGPRVHKMNRNGPDHPSHTNPCFLCSRFRRGVLYRLAPQLGFNKIALGHHADDLIETLLLNLFFSGQIKSMPPKLHSDDGRNTVVRPLAHVFESETAAYAARRNLPVLRSACRACAAPELSQRRWVKTLLSQIETKHPGTKGYLLAALSHVRPSHLLDRTLCDHNPATP